jgi:hypothetical protein
MGTGVDEVRVLIILGMIEPEGDRFVGRSSGRRVPAGQFEVARRRRPEDDAFLLASRLPLMQDAVLVFPAVTDQFPELRTGFLKAVFHDERLSPRRLRGGRLLFPGGLFRGPVLPSLGQRLLGGSDSLLGGTEPIFLNMIAKGRRVRGDRQLDRLDRRGKRCQDRRHARRDRGLLIGILGIATEMQVGLCIEVVVEDARQPVLFQIGLPRDRIQSHLVRFKDRAEAVVIELTDRVVLVVVALGAVDRQTQERLARMFDRTVEPGRTIEEIVVTGEEAGRPYDVGIVRRQFVTGQHLLDHPIVALVGVERFDNPVAPMPEMLLAVTELFAEAIPIGVPPDIHPVTRPAFPMPLTAQQFVDDAFPGTIVLQLFDSGRQADQVEVEAADLQRPRGQWLGLQPLLPAVCCQESVDWIGPHRRIGVFQRGHGGVCDWAEGPMIPGIDGHRFLGSLGARFDPAAEDVDFVR